MLLKIKKDKITRLGEDVEIHPKACQCEFCTDPNVEYEDYIEEAIMEEKDKTPTKTHKLWGLTKEGWEQRKKLAALGERIKGVRLKLPESCPDSKDVAKAAGKTASNVAKPVVKVYDKLTGPFDGMWKAFKEGWKDG